MEIQDGHNSWTCILCSFGEICPECGVFCVFMAESSEGVEEVLIKFAVKNLQSEIKLRKCKVQLM